jgi:predicted amidophosphoribosyltransferase
MFEKIPICYNYQNSSTPDKQYTEVMRINWEQLINLLWPNNIKTTDVLKMSIRHFKGTLYLLPYHQPETKAIIKANKYQASKQAAEKLALMLDDYLTTCQPEFTIIPMPISKKRWRERGYNHITLITTHSLYSKSVQENILLKTTHTTQQTQASRTQRTQQQIGTFVCNADKCHTLPKLVILLDDVVTTGGTMDAARAALIPHLPADTKLLCLALAH